MRDSTTRPNSRTHNLNSFYDWVLGRKSSNWLALGAYFKNRRRRGALIRLIEGALTSFFQIVVRCNQIFCDIWMCQSRRILKKILSLLKNYR